MSNLFHVGPNGPGPCSAKQGNCPFGGDSGIENHYTSEKAAEAAYEASMEKELHKTLTKGKEIKSKDFNIVKQSLYKKAGYEETEYYPMSYENLMAIPEEQLKESIERIERVEPDSAAYGLLLRAKSDVIEDLHQVINERGRMGKKKANSPEALSLDKKILHLRSVELSIEKKMKELTNSWSFVAIEYIMAETAYRVRQPRVVDGISLGPGEGIARGLYSTKGEFLGLLKVNMNGPNRGVSAVAEDGTRTSFTEKGATPEARYEHIKSQGYVIGQAIVPVSLYQDWQHSYHRAKTSTGALKSNPARPVPDFDQGPLGWGNTTTTQEVKIF